MEGYQKYRTYVRFLPCHLLWMKQSSSISFMSSDGACALAKSSASEHTQSASETCATPQWLLLSLNACGIICLMRPATAVFWSPRYSDGFKHVTAMFVLLAVPMRSQYSMQLALMYNCELINALLKTFGGLYALVDVVASFHVGPKPPERQSMIRY